jgi:hypothetical protein
MIMADANAGKPAFRWKRFAVTFLVVLVLMEVGGRTERGPAEPSMGVAYEIGRVFGAAVIVLVIYLIDSAILHKSPKSHSPGRKPPQDEGS